MLKIENLSLEVGNFSLKNISFIVKEGTFHVIVGDTGCGKTLLLESIMGLKKYHNGAIFIDGKDAMKIPTEMRGMAYVPQDLAIFPHLNVRENIYYGSRVRKMEIEQLKEQTDELIKITGIEKLLDRRPKHLSGGEKQRIAFVRAIAAGSKILVMDEPLSSLNQSLKVELQYLLKNLHEKYQLTIIMVTHDLEEAFLLADSISVMSEGKILQTSPKRELYNNPGSTEVANFLGVSNLLTSVVSEIDPTTTKVFCPEINASFNVKNNKLALNQGQKVMLGIRKDEIMILREDLQKNNQTNLLTGTILSISEKGAVFQLLFIPANSLIKMEIELPNHAFYKLNIKQNSKVVITLKEESIFLIKKTR